jgi:hypothetical protein
MMHGQIDHQLAVGRAFDGRDIELARRVEIVVELAGRPVLVLLEIDDLVGDRNFPRAAAGIQILFSTE